MTDSDLFELDQRLAATSIGVTRRAGIEVRLVNDCRYQSVSYTHLRAHET